MMLSLLIASGVLIQQNYAEISSYVNRPLTEISIENMPQHVSSEALAPLLNQLRGQGFFDLDVNAAKELLQSHPWIARVEIQRVWPNTIAIEITEEVAIARWGNSSLINQYSELFSPGDIQQWDTLPILIGPPGTQAQLMSQYHDLNQSLMENGLRAGQISLSARGSWELVLTDNTRVVIGREDIERRVSNFARLYSHMILRSPPASGATQLGPIDTVDLRYNNGFSVKRQPLEIAAR
ncbi:MAG: cell division protein FtsQ [Pseudohongiella sp.]|nr:MAG: cell division protein FtsQ [Pseudohongiella sp.]